MKIDYAQIITSANERKEQLEAIEEHLGDIAEQAANLTTALYYFSNLRILIEDLDPEGKNLIPKIKQVGGNVGYLCNELLQQINHKDRLHQNVLNLCVLAKDS